MYNEILRQLFASLHDLALQYLSMYIAAGTGRMLPADKL